MFAARMSEQVRMQIRKSYSNIYVIAKTWRWIGYFDVKGLFLFDCASFQRAGRNKRVYEPERMPALQNSPVNQ